MWCQDRKLNQITQSLGEKGGGGPSVPSTNIQVLKAIIFIKRHNIIILKVWAVKCALFKRTNGPLITTLFSCSIVVTPNVIHISAHSYSHNQTQVSAPELRFCDSRVPQKFILFLYIFPPLTF